MLDQIERVKSENQGLKEKLMETEKNWQIKYSEEIKTKNEILQVVAKRSKDLDAFKEQLEAESDEINQQRQRLVFDQDLFSKQKVDYEADLNAKMHKLNQEKFLIQTDRQLLFEKLNSSDVEKSVLSITSSMTSLNEIQPSPANYALKEN